MRNLRRLLVIGSLTLLPAAGAMLLAQAKPAAPPAAAQAKPAAPATPAKP